MVPTFFLDKNLVHFGNIAELVVKTWFCGGSPREGCAINIRWVKIFTGIPGFLWLCPGFPGISSGTAGHLRMTFSRRVWYPNGTRDLAAQAAYVFCAAQKLGGNAANCGWEREARLTRMHYKRLRETGDGKWSQLR